MDDLIARLPELPYVVWTVILVPIFGALGVLVGMFARRWADGRWAYLVPMLIGFAVANASANLIADAQAGDRQAKKLVAELAVTEPLKTIIRLEPPVRGELEEGIVRALKGGTTEQKSAMARRVAVNIVQVRFARAVPSAGAAQIHRTVATELAGLRALESRPTLCVDVYLGRGLPNIDQIEPGIGKEMLAAKAAVIESAATRPEKLENLLTLNEIMGLFTRAAKARGGDNSALSKIGRIAELPPEEGCAIATQIETLLVDLDPKETAAVMKTLWSLSTVAPK
jgi:hypothetical protein